MRKNAIRTLLFLGVATALTLSNAAAQTYPMPPNVPFDSNPAQPGSPTSKVLTYGVDSSGNTIPVKTLRITNNTDKTVFPIMRNPNSSVTGTTHLPVVGLYDPYDPPLKEYRGYVGYQQSGTYFFGLQPGQSITVPVPLVFWNGGRVGVGTSGDYLTPTQPNQPNPLNYDPNALKSIAPAPAGGGSISNGIIMWYQGGTAVGPAPDSDDQLAEWTFRDHNYLANSAITQKTYNEIPDNQLVTLANIDVSFVDSLYLPLAFEALDVWIMPQASGTGPNGNRNAWTPGSDPQPFGWTGAVNTTAYLQGLIQQFTASPTGGKNALLGDYFGGHGWPFYNIPNPNNDKNQPIKIPSGASIFPQSPLLGTRSSYYAGTWQSTKYMLSSGGTSAIQVTIGWSGTWANLAGSSTLSLNSNPSEKQQFETIAIGDIVTGNPPTNPPLPNPIQPGTTVLHIDPTGTTVTLSLPLVHSSSASSFTFAKPTHDYAAEAMIRLWYSWAEYYRTHWKDNNPLAPTSPVQIKGSMTSETATITFDKAHPELVEGMAVGGPGLDNAQTEVGIHQGDALILKIAADQKSVIVSQVSNTTTVQQNYTFSPPQKLLYTPAKNGDPGYPLLNLSFPTVQEWRKPYEFSQTVYKIMASMNQIGQPNDNNVCKYMEDIIGANMGYIFNQAGKDSADGQMVIAMIRDLIKSALRGVSNFTEYPDVIQSGTHAYWYPAPSDHLGGQTFNVFNLDPFVWFVHVKLGFSGYGFSVDDDTADIGAGGAGQLQLSVTGTGGLTNANEWFIQAPYGPVHATATYSGTSQGDTLYNGISNVVASGTNPIKVTSAGQVQLKEGDTVVISQVNGITNADGTHTAKNISQYTFDLWSEDGKTPVVGTGTYNPHPTPGRWAYPLHPYIDTGSDLKTVFYRVTGDDALGTFLGTPVNVVNSPTKAGEKIRVWQLGQQSTGRLLLNAPLLGPNGIPLPAGTYQFIFSGSYLSNSQ